MTINLLPTDKKAKIKKEKQTPAPIIQMTGPVEAPKKTKPVTRGGGVLGFFKQTFIKKPKKIPTETEEEKKLAEQKIILEKKIIYEKPKVALRPQIEFTKPKPVVKSSLPKPVKKSGFFASIFGKKSVAPIHIEEKIIVPAATPTEHFPKYQPVKIEKVVPDATMPKRQPEVIRVTTQEFKAFDNGTTPKPFASAIGAPSQDFPRYDKTSKIVSAPDQTLKTAKSDKGSFWGKLLVWLKKIFSRKPRPINSAVLPKDIKKVEQQISTKAVLPRQEKKPSVSPKAPIKKESYPAAPKPAVESFVPPLVEKISPQPTEKVFSPQPPRPQVISEKPSGPEVSAPPSAVPPKKETVVAPKVKSNFIAPLKPLPHNEKKSGYSTNSWWQSLWVKIKKLFSRNKAEMKTIPATPDNKLLGETVPSQVSKSLGEKIIRSVGHEEKLQTSSRKNGLRFTLPEESISKIPGLDWEVNLVPEEALEHEIPVTKILYLALAFIVSVSCVFGGWLAANWYFNQKIQELNSINSEISALDASIRSYKNLQDEVKSLNTSLNNVKTMLEKHVSWSQLFTKLERYTLPEVYYKSLSADVNGTVTLSASAKDYETAIKQLYIYQQASDFVDSATISGITFAGRSTAAGVAPLTRLPAETQTDPKETVNFGITLSVIPSIFYQSY